MYLTPDQVDSLGRILNQTRESGVEVQTAGPNDPVVSVECGPHKFFVGRDGLVVTDRRSTTAMHDRDDSEAIARIRTIISQCGTLYGGAPDPVTDAAAHRIRAEIRSLAQHIGVEY